MERDPVCGMSVNSEQAPETVEHGGRRYYFCSGGCRAAFEREPARYLK